jgi:ribonuclease HI
VTSVSAVTKPIVDIWCDGACSPNPGLGGWGVVLRSKENTRELSGAERDTTNNRMELTAAIRSLEALKVPCVVTLHTDSTYVMNAFHKRWLANWKRNGWLTGEKKPVSNKDLWQQLEALINKHEVSWKWVRGHSTDEGNNRADELAVNARLELAKSA